MVLLGAVKAACCGYWRAMQAQKDRPPNGIERGIGGERLVFAPRSEPEAASGASRPWRSVSRQAWAASPSPIASDALRDAAAAAHLRRAAFPAMQKACTACMADPASSPIAAGSANSGRFTDPSARRRRCWRSAKGKALGRDSTCESPHNFGLDHGREAAQRSTGHGLANRRKVFDLRPRIQMPFRTAFCAMGLTGSAFKPFCVISTR